MNTAEKIKVGDVYKSDGGHPYLVTAVGVDQSLVRVNGQNEEMIQNAACIFTIGTLIERDGKVLKPEPKPETLEDRVKAKYGGYEVVMLEWVTMDPVDILKIYSLGHFAAQSMKGFYKYVYVSINSGFYVRRLPTDIRGDKTVQPIAGLFEKAQS